MKKKDIAKAAKAAKATLSATKMTKATATKAAHTTDPTLASIWKRYCDTFDTDILKLLPNHARVLQSIVNTWDPTIPNLLVYGAAGIPLFPIWNYLVLAPLKRRLADLTHQQSTLVSNAVRMPYTETDAYLYIDLLHPDMPKDGDALLDFLKSVLPSRCMHLHKHIVILDNIDVLTGRDAAFSQVMRVLLERYSSNVWFVATTNRVGALEAPIMSRFFSVRMPLPSTDEVAAILSHLGLPAVPPTRNLVNALRPQPDPLDMADSAIIKAPPPFTLQAVRQEAQRLIQVYAPLSQVAYCILARTPEKKRASIVCRLAEIEAMYHARRKGRDMFYYEAMLLAGGSLPLALLPSTSKGNIGRVD